MTKCEPGWGRGAGRPPRGDDRNRDAVGYRSAPEALHEGRLREVGDPGHAAAVRLLAQVHQRPGLVGLVGRPLLGQWRRERAPLRLLLRSVAGPDARAALLTLVGECRLDG